MRLEAIEVPCSQSDLEPLIAHQRAVKPLYVGQGPLRRTIEYVRVNEQPDFHVPETIPSPFRQACC